MPIYYDKGTKVKTLTNTATRWVPRLCWLLVILLGSFLSPPHTLCGALVFRFGGRPATAFRTSPRRHPSAQLFGERTTSSDSERGFTGSAAEAHLLQLSTAHFTSQALHAFVLLGIADAFGMENGASGTLEGKEIATRLAQREVDPVVVPHDAVIRILRLLTSANVVFQAIGKDDTIHFGLAETGMLLRQPKESTTAKDNSLAPFMLHWLETPIWTALSELPQYLRSSGSGYPFDRGNRGMSAPDYYSSNPVSNQYRSLVAQRVSSSEIPALVDFTNFDWTRFANQTIVDIGGGYGDLMAAIATACNHERHLNITCFSLDLPSVVAGVEAPEGVNLVPGDMFDPSTIPTCDVIISKHVLCDWEDDDVIRMLKSCHSVLSTNGEVMIVDAVLLDGPEASNQWQIQAAIDVMLMLTGRHMDRSVSQWRRLALIAGFRLDRVISCTSSPSLNITLFSKV